MENTIDKETHEQQPTTANKRQQVENFNTSEVHFIHTRSTSDAQIQKFESRNKHKVEQHRGPKDQTSCAKNGLSFLLVTRTSLLFRIIYTFANSKFYKMTIQKIYDKTEVLTNYRKQPKYIT